jgi:hypothetical protein
MCGRKQSCTLEDRGAKAGNTGVGRAAISCDSDDQYTACGRHNIMVYQNLGWIAPIIG